MLNELDFFDVPKNSNLCKEDKNFLEDSFAKYALLCQSYKSMSETVTVAIANFVAINNYKGRMRLIDNDSDFFENNNYCFANEIGRYFLDKYKVVISFSDLLKKYKHTQIDCNEIMKIIETVDNFTQAGRNSVIDEFRRKTHTYTRGYGRGNDIKISKGKIQFTNCVYFDTYMNEFPKNSDTTLKIMQAFFNAISLFEFGKLQNVTGAATIETYKNACFDKTPLPNCKKVTDYKLYKNNKIELYFDSEKSCMEFYEYFNLANNSLR